MRTALAAAAAFDGRSAVFAGADVCREAGLPLPEGSRRPVFEDDVWDFTDVVGLPVQLALSTRRFEFTGITDERWRLVGKELVLAMLAPRHPAVAPLPRAHRTALHLSSCAGRLDEIIRFCRWLSEHGVTSLGQVDTRICDAYTAHRRYVLDEHGAVVGEQSPAVRRAAAQVVVDLVNYRELFTADRVAADLRPWGGATASAIAEMPSGRTENKTQPVDDTVLQPMLAAALFLVSALGPHAVELAHQIREADKLSARKARGLRAVHVAPVAEFTGLLSEYTETCTPLPMLADHHVADRLANGWSADDPLLTVATGVLARQAGITQFEARWMSRLRDPLEDAVASVGVKEVFARNSVEITTADTLSVLPWTLPLHRPQAAALVGIVRTATMIVLATASGMRSSELMELRIGCRLPIEEPVPALTRYRLASKVIKGQPLGGTDDEWVVIEPVYRAVELAEDLHDDRKEGTLLFGRFAFSVRYKWFRNWINSPAGQRLGLAPIPDGQVNLRRLRRTLALEMAYRPGGVLAAKIHLKHIAVATTEGYASRPGGAQAELLAEVNKHESDRNLQLVLEEFQNYQQGILPAGPGARNLTEFFASIDEKLDATAATAPKTQRSDRDVLNLLTKRAKVLHLGPANYCWFTDPSRALCLKLAGTPTADRPLVGMCDSARCPQATHHPCHRPVWAEHAERTGTFLGQLGTTRKTERTRLQADYDRATRVVTEIDAACTTMNEDSA
ncbi:site-specific integrase [Streptomyces sp. NBC_00201]|uniref:site-specific integrase n=1 Tax=unclassified Streptomyces TaxID=2593676 RepID=UPI00225C192D|nr:MULTISPECIES: site-specific integrase [unclassified Streptomyces]MCX5063700.1 site-specific integrase [Streptomyces sp. NBC_00452]MCX5251855.1 site-specific integrase [Streptomyces sp. NBC_00201]MCX5294242.1 site-specific integrase [Streptomyces sp. NBC_00183]